jgi:hypothetical protein
MSKDNRKGLPARSDANAKGSDQRYKQQEEYDNLGKDELQKESEVRNTQHEEQMRDSQMGGESMKPITKGNAMGQRGRDQHPE